MWNYKWGYWILCFNNEPKKNRKKQLNWFEVFVWSLKKSILCMCGGSKSHFLFRKFTLFGLVDYPQEGLLFFLASMLHVLFLFPLQLGSSLTDRLKEKELEFDTRFEECFGLANKVFIVWTYISSSFYLLYFAQ